MVGDVVGIPGEAGGLRAGARGEAVATTCWRAETGILCLPFILLPWCDFLGIYPPVFQIYLALG